MEMLPRQSPSANDWAEQFVKSLQAQRDQAGEVLARYQARFERVQAVLEQQMCRLEEAAGVASPAAAATGAAPPAVEAAGVPHPVNRAASAAAAPPATGTPLGGHLDWEAEKRRVLAALESDFDPHDPEQQAQRLRIEDMLQSTERTIAAKDRQIDELKRQLSQPAGDGPPGAGGQAALDRLLDGDSLVQQERERLKQLQDECQQKLRQAEIDLSLQRGKLARDRADLEERIRLADCALAGGPVAPSPAERQKRPARGRWLDRLGLTEEDREGSGKKKA
jgi:hypothetical protein